MHIAVDMQQSTKADPVVIIRKEECVNHVTKKMNDNSRRLKKEYKGKKLEYGKGTDEKGRLTNAITDAIQNFYGHTICDNNRDVPKMSGTIEKSLHVDCPKGPKSWHSYQHDKVLGTSTYVPPNNPLLEAVNKVAMPIFNCLGYQSFLDGCKNISNQNIKESFIKVLWSFCLKE